MPIRYGFVVLGFALAAAVRAETGPGPLVPLPAQMKTMAGSFPVVEGVKVFAPRSASGTARFLVDSVWKASGVKLDLRTGARPRNYGGIELAIDPSLASLGKEGYRLEVERDQVTLRSSDDAGLFYGVQTLRQLLPLKDQGGYAWPCVRIEDKPRFGRRGFMLDCARHFVKKQTILSLLEALASFKINTFQWHLVDNDGWRLYIPKYSDLVKPQPIKFGWYHQADGFYTPRDVKEIVQKAKSLHIAVVPEIEMPGHSMHAASILPEGSCLQPDGTPTPPGGTFEYCLGSDKLISALEDILLETMKQFPDSPVIHLGGDEADDSHWKNCSRCQARMKALGITDPRLLQKWFMAKMSEFVRAHGRRSMAWADRLELGVPDGQIVHGWHGGEVEEAVAKGFDAIQSDASFTYFDYGQGPGDTFFGGCNLMIDRVYQLDPVAGLTPEQAGHVLGTQAQLWTEMVDDSRVFTKTFPRTLAFAEVAWTPQELRGWNEFNARLERFLPRLDAQGIRYFATPHSIGEWQPKDMSVEWKDVEWDVTANVKAGENLFEFVYIRGAHALQIQSVELLVDGKTMARDEHPGRTGAGSSKNVYTLTIAKVPRGKSYTLRARIKSDGGTDSSGTVLVR